jgi:hypothetical protein
VPGLRAPAPPKQSKRLRRSNLQQTSRDSNAKKRQSRYRWPEASFRLYLCLSRGRLMVEIKHLSVSVREPERAARALAEMTSAKALPFPSKNMPGAWFCVWDEGANHLVEFLPNHYLMHRTNYGADFKKQDTVQNFNSTHFQLEVTTPLSENKSVGC